MPIHCAHMHLSMRTGQMQAGRRSTTAQIAQACRADPLEEEAAHTHTHLCQSLCCAGPPGAATAQQRQGQAGAATASTASGAPPVALMAGTAQHSIRPHWLSAKQRKIEHLDWTSEASSAMAKILPDTIPDEQDALLHPSVPPHPPHTYQAQHRTHLQL